MQKPPIFQNKKYITFDCYGTLIDWEKGYTKSKIKNTIQNSKFDAVWINRKHEKPTQKIKPDLEFKDLQPLTDVL